MTQRGLLWQSQQIAGYGNFVNQTALTSTLLNKLVDLHGHNPNADGYYFALRTGSLTAPAAGAVLKEPIWVPAQSSFSWTPYGNGYPYETGGTYFWWVVSTTNNVYTVPAPAVNFYVSATCRGLRP